MDEGVAFELYDSFPTVMSRDVLESGESQLRLRRVRLLELKFRRLELSGHTRESEGQR